METGANHSLAEPKKLKKKKKKVKEEMKVRISENLNSEIQPPSNLLNVKFETIREQPSTKACPVIGYFPSGFDPNRTQSEPPRVRFYQNSKHPNRKELVVSPSSGGKVDYVGFSHSGEAAAPQVCSYALGVLDKATNTLRIVPIEANKIFRLEPRIRGFEEHDDGSLQNMDGQDIKDKESLVYLTKRTAEKMKRRKKLQQTQDPDLQGDLNSKLDDIKINKEAFVPTSYSARNIPPYNMSAQNPHEVYPLKKIIFEGEWEHLYDILELFRSEKELAEGAYPTFVCNRVHKLNEVKDEEAKETLACIFSYITHLVKFKDKHSIDGVSSASSHFIPGILSQKFKYMFAPSDSRNLASDKNDLLISYVLVLTLIVDNFETNFEDIAKDLRMSPLTLRVHYQNLGCKIKKVGAVSKAALSAPPEFPIVRRKRKR